MKDKVQDQVISLEHTSTERMLADPLTKAYHPTCSENMLFREYVASMGLRKA